MALSYKTRQRDNTKKLYNTLSADFKAEKNFYFADRGKGTKQGRKKIRIEYFS